MDVRVTRSTYGDTRVGVEDVAALRPCQGLVDVRGTLRAAPLAPRTFGQQSGDQGAAGGHDPGPLRAAGRERRAAGRGLGAFHEASLNRSGWVAAASASVRYSQAVFQYEGFSSQPMKRRPFLTVM